MTLCLCVSVWMAASALNIHTFFFLSYFKKGDNNAGLQAGRRLLSPLPPTTESERERKSPSVLSQLNMHGPTPPPPPIHPAPPAPSHTRCLFPWPGF